MGINGAQGSSYTTPAEVVGNSGSKFSVVVSNSAGNTTSTSATLTVSAASTGQYTLTSTASSLNFAATVGGGNPAAQSLTIHDNDSALYAIFLAAVTQPWLSVNPASSCAAGTLTVSVNTTGLAAGSYTGALLITSPQEINSPFSIPIALTITGSGTTLLSSTASLSFGNVNIGGSSSLSVTLTNSWQRQHQHHWC